MVTVIVIIIFYGPEKKADFQLRRRDDGKPKILVDREQLVSAVMWGELTATCMGYSSQPPLLETTRFY